MKLLVEPLLHKQRELYDLTPAPRFAAYLRLMTAGTDEMVLPLAAFNPMGKPHVPRRLDRYVAIGGEALAEEAAREAEGRLDGVDGELRIALVLADDLGGGWTHRYTTEAAHYFEGKYEGLRGWAVVLLWSSEEPSPERLRRDVLASIYRSLHVLRHGLPASLREMMSQEGRAAVFAGVDDPSLPPLPLEDLPRVRATIAAHLDATHFPVTFACLYGDGPARALGLPELGLPERAGFTLARLEASRGPRPEALLRPFRAPARSERAWPTANGSDAR